VVVDDDVAEEVVWLVDTAEDWLVVTFGAELIAR
jgi:hypothetical protein